MDQKMRCQSCGMPLGTGFYGTEGDGSDTQEYCRFCYQKGMFTNPDETVESMIAKSVDNMANELHLDEKKAKELANTFIPHLRRWRENL